MPRFAVDSGKAAFVVIDMQNFACLPAKDGAMPGLDEVVERINRLAGVCRRSEVPVIWVRHSISSRSGATGGGLYPLFHDEEHNRAVLDRSAGTELYAAMEVDSARDYVVFKNRYSAFLSTPPELRQTLGTLGRSQLVFAGVAANVCVESTLRDAMQLDYEVILLADGTTAPDAAALQGTLANTRAFFGDVQTARQVAEALSAGS